MSELELKAGPQLLSRRWVYDDQTEQGSYVSTDVTSRAAEFLFESVTLAEDVTLADIFALLDAAPVLQTVYRRDFCVEMLEEARKGVSPDFKPGYAPDAIEYLELYQVWNFNSATREYLPMHRLDFHGIGYALREPLDEGHGFIYPAGHRIQWGISTASLRELLSLPVRVRKSVPVCEDDLDAKNWGSEIETVSLGGVSLGQVLHGVFWELSFHGGPQQAAEFMNELKETVEEVRQGTATTVSGDDIFDELDRPGVEALFDATGEHRAREVSFALRQLEDDEPVAEGLRRALGDAVQVKPEYADMAAKPFRKLFREASRAPKADSA